MNLVPLAKDARFPLGAINVRPCISYSGRGGHWVGANVRTGGHWPDIDQRGAPQPTDKIKNTNVRLPGHWPDIDRDISMSGTPQKRLSRTLKADIDRVRQLQATCPAPRPRGFGFTQRVRSLLLGGRSVCLFTNALFEHKIAPGDNPVTQLPVPAGLTERQNRFVDLYIDLGGKHAGRCARLAGIADSGADAWASRALRHPAILTEIKRRAITTLTAETVASVRTIVAIRDNPLADDAVRLRAASQVLDRGGVLAATLQRLEVDVQVTDTRDSLMAEIMAFTGGDPAVLKALGVGGIGAFVGQGTKRKVKVIDQDPEPVDADDLAEVWDNMPA
jgi:hypothetical protein